MNVRDEEASSHGRADRVVHLGGQIFILEFGMAEDAEGAVVALETAMSQMRDRGCVGKCHEIPVHFIGVVCGRDAWGIRS